MKKKIVFFSMAPLLGQHVKRLGEEVLTANGFQVSYYDFSPLVYPGLQRQETLPDRFESKDYVIFTEYEKVFQAIEALDKECFLIIVVGYYEMETFRIYKAVSKSKIPYAIQANVAQPFGIGRQESWGRKLFSIVCPFKLKKLKAIFFKPCFASLLGIRPPDMCILGGKKSLEFNGKTALVDNNTKLLWAHNHDYDEYLRNLNKSKAQENIAVFIDLGSPQFPWDEYLPKGVTHLTVGRYYPSLCKFFNYVEESLGVKVVIAAHPKSNHGEHPEYFGKRKTIRYQTHELVRSSKLVISHASTALSFVVLEKKPVLFLTTAEYKIDLGYSKKMEEMATDLGKSLINIDETPYFIDWEKELAVNMDLYSTYKQNYIKRDGSENLNTWEIVANRLKSF